ncbi:MAG: hypothetical protein QOH18_1897, partial [Solirubrobacterales bacterium]|nr:hypothetical protein [Solirubrobacterales bacterium]
SGEDGRRTAETLGAADFVAKPFTSDELRDAVTRIVSAERSSVLVVDDDEALRRLVVETLARDGGELREAADGTEALAMIAASQPDVVVLDLRMPGLDGFGVLDRLLERPETSGLPVVVLTGRDLSESERRFLGARSASLLEKREYSGNKLRRLVHDAPAITAPPPKAAKRPEAVEDKLTAELVAASGEERRRIAKDIHDDSIQAITALGMRSQILQRSLTDPGQLTMLADLEQTMQVSIARLRQVADDLAPPSREQDRFATPVGDSTVNDGA